MKTITIAIDDIYVPVKRRRDLNPESVEALAESIMEDGLQTPIGVRRDGDSFVLVSGLLGLVACRALG